MAAATQDIAVDGKPSLPIHPSPTNPPSTGWALTLLSQPNLSYASTAQTIGIGIGNALSFTVFLAFNSIDFSNKYFRSPSRPLDYPLVSLGGYMKFWAVVFVGVTVGLAVLKKEDPPSEDDPDMDVKKVYKVMWSIVRLKSTSPSHPFILSLPPTPITDLTYFFLFFLGRHPNIPVCPPHLQNRLPSQRLCHFPQTSRKGIIKRRSRSRRLARFPGTDGCRLVGCQVVTTCPVFVFIFTSAYRRKRSRSRRIRKRTQTLVIRILGPTCHGCHLHARRRWLPIQPRQLGWDHLLSPHHCHHPLLKPHQHSPIRRYLRFPHSNR